MAGSLMRAGFGSALRRLDLVFLVYGVQLAFAAVLAAPIARSLGSIVGPTGFGTDLVAGSDIVLWADILGEEARSLARSFLHLLWFVPIVMLWKAAKGVGLVHALGIERGNSFWRGAMRFGLRSVLVGMLFAALSVVLGAVLLMLAVGIARASSDPVAAYWIVVVCLPLSLLALLVGIDLLRSVSRAVIATADASTFSSIRAGFEGILRQPQLLFVYGVWKLFGLFCLSLSFLAELQFAAGGSGAVVALFLLQQVLLMLGALWSVSWFGSLEAAGRALWSQEEET